MKLRVAVPVLLILFSLFSEASAQWQMMKKDLLGIKWLLTQGGALEYANGTVWAGSDKLYFSRDLGVTWQQTAPFTNTGEWVTCIRFWNDTGLVSTSNGRLFKSTDGGMAWTDIYEESAIGSVAFNGSADDILMLLAAPAYVLRSTDGGKSWKRDIVQRYGQDLISARGQALLTATDDASAQLYHTTNHGSSWIASTATFNYDSFSLSVDSCTNNIYVVNEEERNPLDGVCKVLITSDLGSTWRTTFTHDRSYLAGAIVAGPTTLYAATLVDGVLRSTDHGESWSSIQGPDTREDTRFLLPIDDNTIFAVDGDGSLWRTTNSGGFPRTVPSTVLSVSSAQLFANTTVTPCANDTASLQLKRVVGDCIGPLEVVKQEIVGADSEYYMLIDTAEHAPIPLDTISVLFTPDTARDYYATLVLTLWNGETREVALGGRGSRTPHITLSSIDISTETIGDEITVPIKADQPIARSCDIRVRYDPVPLEYLGLASGHTGVTERSIAPGEVVLHVAGSNALAFDSVIAALRFRFLPIDAASTAITIDSLTYATDSACGDYVATTATVTSTADECTRQMLATYLKTGAPPVFTISPNPASRNISISSNRSVTSDISIYNTLGELVMKRTTTLGIVPTEFDIQALPEGLATVSIATGDAPRSYRLLIVHR